MNAVRRLLVVCALVLWSHVAAHAHDANVGLVDQVAGDVSYAGNTDRGTAHAFMKMRQGDRFTLADGAQLRVVYFRNGRQETWRGPASFTSGSEHSELLTGTVPGVATLPVAVPQRIQKIPELIQMAKLGGIQVRGVAARLQPSAEQDSDVAAARITYAQLRRQLPQEDITPALYLFTVLQDYLLYDDMKTTVDEMLRMQPGNHEAAQLAEWVRGHVQPGR